MLLVLEHAQSLESPPGRSLSESVAEDLKEACVHCLCSKTTGRYDPVVSIHSYCTKSNGQKLLQCDGS